MGERPNQPGMERLLTAPTASTSVRWKLTTRAADVPEYGVRRRVRWWGVRRR